MDRCYLSESVEVLWRCIEPIRGTKDMKEGGSEKEEKKGKKESGRQWMRENMVKQ